MEIRTLEANEREGLMDLLDDYPLPDGRQGREYFEQRFEADPTFSIENIMVAVDHGELLGCAQIVPRWLLVLGHKIPIGGLSAIYMHPKARGQGFASALIEQTSQTMRERGMELSLAWTGRPTILTKLGWHCWAGQRAILRRPEKGMMPRGDSNDSNEIELVLFDPRQDRGLSSVKAIHSAYSSSRNGTVFRDDLLWDSSLELAGNPEEEFWIARRGGLAVAYARAAVIDEVLTVTELGRFEDGSSALAKLISSLLDPRDPDTLATNGRDSAALRSFLVLPTFDDIGLTVSLEHEGAGSHPIDEHSGMIRCLNLNALAARLDVELLDDEDGQAFLKRILPPDGFVFWPADRF